MRRSADPGAVSILGRTKDWLRYDVPIHWQNERAAAAKGKSRSGFRCQNARS